MRIALIACANMLATSLTFPKELLVAASQLSKSRYRKRQELQFIVAGLNGTADHANLGDISFNIDCDITELDNIDLIIFPALWRGATKSLKYADRINATVTRLHQQGTRIAATGTGTWIIAEIGLLDNRSATTHWYYLDQFRQRYPLLKVRDHHLITQADKIYCASSINSLADLTIHLISELFDPAIAKLVEQQFSPEVRQHYRAKVFIEGASNPHNDELIAQTQHLIRESHQRYINFDDLAKQLGVSQRTLNRRFLAATGSSPSQYLLELRINTAKDLLRQTNLDMTEIAASSGFGNAAYLSSCFKKSEGSSPSTYRKSVKSKLFS